MKKILAALMAFLILSGCAMNPFSPQPQAPESSATSQEEAVLPLPQEDKISTVKLVAVGDNLIHDVIYQQAGRRTQGKGYDFKPVYEQVKAQLLAADIAFINQEAPMAKSFPPATYPRFNTPQEMAENLKEVGFDVVNIANNHMLDQGRQGLWETMELLRATQGLTMIGAFATEADYDTPPVLTKEDISFAFLGFTQHTNGLRLPDEDSAMIVYTDELEAMERQIITAKQVADVVVVSVHWGEENTAEPTPYQRNVAKKLAEYGADIIIGTHPHVLQPVEVLESAGGNKTVVLYSLGNFVSAQLAPANMIGAIASIAVSKNHTTDEVTVLAPQLTPVITHFGAGFRELSIIPLSAYTPELAAQHGVALAGEQFDLPYINTFLKDVIGAEYLATVTQK